MKQLLLLPISVVLGVMGAGCSRVPSHVIQPAEMAGLMADMEMGEAVVENEPGRWPTDSLRRTLLQSIYAAHGVTSEEVDSSLSWYGRNLMEYKEVCDLTVQILEKRVEDARTAGVTNPEMRRLEANFGQSADGDSVDIWSGPRWRRFTAVHPASLITFSHLSDSRWEPGDRVTLRFKTVSASPGAKIEAMSAMRYKGSDSVSYVLAAAPPMGGWTELLLQGAPQQDMARFYGAISVSVPAGGEVWIDSISLVREHKQGFAPGSQRTVLMD